MSGDPKCPACILKAGVRLGFPGTPTFVEPSCTGRPGCVRTRNDGLTNEQRDAILGLHPRHTTPVVSYEPASGDTQPAAGEEGGADIVEQLRLKAAISRSETDGAESMESAAIDEAADEITRLRAKVERLREGRDRLLMADAANRAHLAADRAARDRAVAEAVLDAAVDVSPEHHVHAIRDINLDAVIASVGEPKP